MFDGYVNIYIYGHIVRNNRYGYNEYNGYKCNSVYLRGGTRKVGKQERNRRKNEGERGGKNT